MRSDGKHLDKYRLTHPAMGSTPSGALYGFFVMGEVRILSSGENHTGELGEWEHVSVSLQDRCPTWDEMCSVKDLFWMENECVLQFHPPKSDYINAMPYCLHLWKPLHAIELPTSMTVGVSRKAKRQAILRRMNRQ